MSSRLNFQNILDSMIDAAKGSLGDSWPKVRSIATLSLKTLARNLVDIEQLKSEGVITNEQAKFKIDLQKNAFKTLLLTEEGLGLLAVEAALKAVVAAVRDAVNGVFGFALL